MSVQVERRYVDGPYGQIHVYDAIPPLPSSQLKTPLICFHQSPVSGLQYQAFQAAMAADRRVICPDTPGFGGSDAPPFAPGIEGYAIALAKGLEALGFGEGRLVDVLGFHTGAQICVELAANRPDLVRRQVLSSLALLTDEEKEKNRSVFGGERPLFTEPDYVGRYYAQQVVDGYEAMSQERRLALFVERMRPGMVSWYGPEAVFTHDTKAALQSVVQPTLLYIMRDTLSENTRLAASLVQRATIYERMDIHGPVGWDSHPNEIAADVRRFLDAAL
ncbi:MAG: alpha/beta fold hydrolase [Rhodospirillaceae bacterium]